MKAISIHEQGGPDIMQYEEAELDGPGDGEMRRLLQTAIGLNYLDTYHRSSRCTLPMPGGPDFDAAGVVEVVGDGVTHLKEGDRIAYGSGPLGSYAQTRKMPANRVSKLPDASAGETAAAMMLNGMTARYLLRETCKAEPDVPVVYNRVDQAVFDVSFDCLSPFGLIAGFDTALEEVTKLNTSLPAANGSHYLTRSRLNTYVESDAASQANVADPFDAVGSGAVRTKVNQIYALAVVVKAYQEREGRKTTGSTVLLP